MRSRIRFNYREHDGSTIIDYSTDAVLLNEIIDEFAMFLRGCGYQVHDLQHVHEWDEDAHPNKN